MRAVFRYAGGSAALVFVLSCSSPTAPEQPFASLWLDGVSGFVQVAHHPVLDLGSGDFTWEVWIKRDRTGMREEILSKKDVMADSEHDLVIFIERDDRAYVFLRETLRGTVPVYLPSTSTIGTDWTHLAAVRTSGIVSLYVNGVAEAFTLVPYDVSSSGPFRIGANRLNDAPADAAPLFLFRGNISEVRVWNVARSPEAIAGSMNRHVGRGSVGLRAYYPLRETTGSVARDASGNGNTGELRGGAEWRIGEAPF
jgi:hypothetical protein